MTNVEKLKQPVALSPLESPTRSPLTLVMVDDNIDEIFLARRQARHQGIINRFVSEQKSENLIGTLTDLFESGVASNVLVLMDITMPKMDGFETLAAIRAHKQFASLPVVMFSASDDAADMDRAIDCGANGYLVKPFTIGIFMSALGGLPQIKYDLFLAPLGSENRVQCQLVQ